MTIIPDKNRYVLERARGRRVLSIGCADDFGEGVSEQTGLLAEAAAQFHGFDVHGGFVARFRDRYDLHEVDVEGEWDCRIAGIDLVVMTEVLEHLKCPVMALRNLKSQYAGAALIASVPNCTSLGRFMHSLIGSDLPDGNHLGAFNTTVLRNVFREAGLQAPTILYYNPNPVTRQTARCFPRLATGLLIECVL